MPNTPPIKEENDDLKGEKLLFSLDALADLSKSIASTKGFHENSKALLHHILGTLLISKGALLLYEESKRQLFVEAARGIKHKSERLNLTLQAVNQLIKHNRPLFIQEASDSLKAFFQDNKNLLGSWQSKLWLPIVIKQKLFGILSLGNKFMNAPYNQNDLSLLNIFAQNIAIAFYNHSLIEDLKRTNFELNYKILELENLYDLGLAISSLMDFNKLANEILMRAISLLDANLGALFVKKEDGSIEIASKFGAKATNEKELREIEQSIVNQIIVNEGEALIVNHPQSSDDLKSRKMLVVPIKVQDKMLGVLWVGDKEGRKKELIDFTKEDARLLSNFANQAAVALENAKLHEASLEKERMERELEVAASIQQNLLPKDAPRIKGFDIASLCIPCRQVGGDYFDFIPLSNNKLGLAIADVSGKGIPASLLVSTLQASLHAHSEGGYSPSQLVTKLAKSMYSCSLPNKFVTFFFAALDLSDGFFTSTNAGHNYPLIINSTGDVKQLKEGGFCLGLFENSEYNQEENQIQSGEILVMYTDGLSEAQNSKEEEFAESGVIEVVRENYKLKAAEIIDKIFESVKKFSSSEQFVDDLTLVILKAE
jgi:sigma-B regulation protein RsbU (phosphoserine phosphatase)